MQFPTHRFYEDVLALFCAGVMVSLGITFFNSQDLLTGGTAGLAIVTMHLSGLSFGLLFFLINVPFYLLAWTKLSKRFTLNTFITVTLVSVMTDYMPTLIHIGNIQPVFAAAVGGMLIGVGMLIMFRHKSSLGGLGILALYVQNHHNIRAGKVGLAFDGVILSSSLLFFSIETVLLSILGAFTLNLLIAVNHKPGRYQAVIESRRRGEASNDQQYKTESSLWHRLRRTVA